MISLAQCIKYSCSEPSSPLEPHDIDKHASPLCASSALVAATGHPHRRCRYAQILAEYTSAITHSCHWCVLVNAVPNHLFVIVLPCNTYSMIAWVSDNLIQTVAQRGQYSVVRHASTLGNIAILRKKCHLPDTTLLMTVDFALATNSTA